MNQAALKDKRGFTLVEFVITLIILGVGALILTMGLVSFTQSWVEAKTAFHATQKAQVAIIRIRRELQKTVSILDETNPSRISFRNLTGNRIIGQDGETIKIAENGAAIADGDVLIDGVESLHFYYYKDYETGEKWVKSDGMTTLQVIEVKMDLLSFGNPFNIFYFLRNNV